MITLYTDKKLKNFDHNGKMKKMKLITSESLNK